MLDDTVQMSSTLETYPNWRTEQWFSAVVLLQEPSYSQPALKSSVPLVPSMALTPRLFALLLALALLHLSLVQHLVVCAVKLYVHAPRHFIYQFPITGQSSFRQGWSINWVELLQEPDCDIGNLSKGELLSDTYSRASVEWEVVESKFAPLPSFWIESVSIRAPKFWVWVHCPKLHGRDVSTEEKPEAQ